MSSVEDDVVVVSVSSSTTVLLSSVTDTSDGAVASTDRSILLSFGKKPFETLLESPDTLEPDVLPEIEYGSSVF